MKIAAYDAECVSDFELRHATTSFNIDSMFIRRQFLLTYKCKNGQFKNRQIYAGSLVPPRKYIKSGLLKAHPGIKIPISGIKIHNSFPASKRRRLFRSGFARGLCKHLTEDVVDEEDNEDEDTEDNRKMKMKVMSWMRMITTMRTMKTRRRKRKMRGI